MYHHYHWTLMIKNNSSHFVIEAIKLTILGMIGSYHEIILSSSLNISPKIK